MFFFTQAQITEIFKQPRENHVPLILDYYKIDLDSASNLKLTDSLKAETKRLGEDLEAWYVDLYFTNQNCYYDEIKSKTANALLSKEEYFSNSSHPEIPIVYHYLLAKAYARLKDVDKTYHHFFIVDDLLKKVGYDKVAVAQNLLVNLADFYAAFEDYSQSLNYIQLGIKYPNNQLINKQNFYMLNNLGFYLLKLKRYTEAEKVFVQVMEESKKHDNNWYVGIGASNIGNVKRIQGVYKEALPYLYLDVQINETQVMENAATSCLYITDCLLHLDSTAKAKEYMDKAHFLAQNSYYQSSFFPTYYEVAGLYYKKIGNFAKVNEMQDSLISLKDSLKTIFDANKLRISSMREKEIKFLEQEKIANNKTQNSIRFRNLVITCLIIVFILIYYALVQKRKKDKIRTAQKEQEAQQTIDLANEKLQSFLAQIKEKNKVIEQYEELNATATQTKENVPFIQNLLQSVILTDEDWTKFRDIFNQAYPAFLPKLKLDYPNLSPAEIRLVVLQQLPISTKHQASMLGISTASLRTARYRLRKKYPELLDDNESNEAE